MDKAILLFAFSLVVVMVGVCELAAQNPPPPPPPLIWKPPDASEVKKYVNSIQGFSVDFIGAPDVSENKGVMSFYTVRRKGSTMVVRVIHFTKEDMDKVKSREVIRQVRTAYGTSSGFKITDLSEDGDDSIEFSSTNKYTFRRVKAKIKDDKLYELYIDVTNWHILQDFYKDRVDAFNQEADRFFNSFHL